MICTNFLSLFQEYKEEMFFKLIPEPYKVGQSPNKKEK